MKQRNASSFATLRISTVLAMLWALPVGPVSAIPIQLTSGGIFVESLLIFGGDVQTFVGLAGPGFLLTTDAHFDQFQFAVGSPNHPLDLLPPGTITGFSGGMQIISGGTPGIPGFPFPPATVLYGGESYFATGDHSGQHTDLRGWAAGHFAVQLERPDPRDQLHGHRFRFRDLRRRHGNGGLLPVPEWSTGSQFLLVHHRHPLHHRAAPDSGAHIVDAAWLGAPWGCRAPQVHAPEQAN